MKRRIVIVIIALGILVLIGVPLSGVLNAATPVNVTMERYNLSRNAVNTNETILTTSNVNVNTFGKLFSDPVDGDIYTQPLIVTGVNIPGKGVHNVVYVATMHNTVYAFDADTVGAPLWSKSLGKSWTGDCTRCLDPPIITSGLDSVDIPGGEDGVLSDPVIDLATKTMYLVSHVASTKPGVIPPTHVIHALDITTGAEKYGGPVTIAGQVSGAFGDYNNNGVISYDAGDELQRPALTLTNGRLLIGMGSSGDIYPFWGWLFAYNATNLKAAPAIWLDAAQGFGNGIWMAGSGPIVDSNGYIYVVTGNGNYAPNSQDATHSPLGNYGDSVVKLRLDTTHNVFNVVDYFTPWNQDYLDGGDLDLGSSNFVLIPGTHLLFGGGKTDAIYLLDTTNMGHDICDTDPSVCNDSNNGDNNDSQIPQEWTGKVSHLHNTPNVWVDPSGHTLVYLFAEQDFLKNYKFDPVAGKFPGNPPISNDENSSIYNAGMPSGMISISSNGSQAGTGIAWTLDYLSNFRAVDATNLNNVLWTDKQSPRDGLGVAAKFVVPVVANGKVYMATRAGRLSVYGLLPQGPGLGMLNGLVKDPPPSTVDLNAEGPIDWAHWGLTNNQSFDHKMGATGPVGMISPITTKGGGPIQFSTSQVGFTWSGGVAPNATLSTPTTTGIFTLKGLGYQDVPSLQFTVPADTTPRILKVYVSSFDGKGELRASLSDGSAPDFDDIDAVAVGGNDYKVYTLAYQAASANQKLFVTWNLAYDSSQTYSDGNVTIEAAALDNYGPVTTPQPEFQPPTNTPSVPTVTITPSPGPSRTPTFTPSPLPPDSFRVKYEALDIDPTELRIRAAINIINLTSVTTDLNQFELRYYFTKDGNGSLVFSCEVAIITCAKVHSSFVPLPTPVTGADTYLDLTFSSQTLPALGGSSGAIQFNITKSDGSSFNQTDDFSFNANLTAFTDWRQIAMLRSGTLIWGAVPTLGKTTLLTPGNGTTGLSSHPTLSWTENPDASRYQVRIISISKNAVVFQQWYSAYNDLSSCPASTCSVTPNVTLPNDQYTWLVETGTPTQAGPWSDTWSFNVGP